MGNAKYWIAGSVGGCVLCASISAQVTQLVSVDSSGAEGYGVSLLPSISSDGRYVAFVSSASNLVPGDTNGQWDIFVHDRLSGTTERVSVSSSGGQGNTWSGYEGALSISGDGRYVAFTSAADNLVSGDTNNAQDVFVHDRLTGTTTLVSVDSSGAEGNLDSGYQEGVPISSDGRYVAFSSGASNLVPGDTNGVTDVFVRDRQTGTTERVSIDSSGAQGNAHSGVNGLSISSDGRYVAFGSSASNLVAGDTNGTNDVFVHDRQTGTTERVNVDSSGVQGNAGSSLIGGVAISSDGRYVAFGSSASNLVAGDTNGHADVFVHDRQSGATTRLSVDSTGAQGNGDSYWASISAHGRYVAFTSDATNLVAGDTNGYTDVFLHDRQTGTTERVSVDASGTQGNLWSYSSSISADGRYVAFASLATNLVPGGTYGIVDVFVRDREAAGFTSQCDPGIAGVIACPCANPPAGRGRGCDNSSTTGGASLSASGVAYLSMDSLVFTTSGERPTALSIVLQGTTSIPAGTVYGQGVRCLGGTLKRLYTKSASGGSITAPNFGAGDPTVSARSAALGNPILAGESRWYLVYYRDPNVLGGCSAISTFNATQTGRVDWSP